MKLLKNILEVTEVRMRQNPLTGMFLRRFPNYLKYYFRYSLSRKYIKNGTGIEIGPSFNPLRVLPAVDVKYVDIAEAEDLKRIYGHDSKNRGHTRTDILDDVETLSSFDDASLDFVIANHLIEHTVNPLQTIVNFLRILRPGGIIFLAVPNRISTFDILRPLTAVEHLIEVFYSGEDRLLDEHYREVVRLVEKLPDVDIPARVEMLKKQGFSIHYHTFELTNFIAMIDFLKNEGYPVKLIQTKYFFISTDEFIAILQKNPHACGR